MKRALETGGGCLLVSVVDRLSDLVHKGEVTERYYNPGDLFDEVHVITTSDDRVDLSLMRKMVGRATVHLHNLPVDRGLFVRSIGWRPYLLRKWAEPAVRLAREIQPTLVRCYGNFLNGYVAVRIKDVLDVPFAVSIHMNPDEDYRRRPHGVRGFLTWQAMVAVEQLVVRRADRVLPVYDGILPYVRRLGARNVEVAYNALNPRFLRRKDDYQLHRPVRVLSVGRQFGGKNPINLVRAVEKLANVHLTMVGDGDLHEQLRDTARQCGIEDRVTFHCSLPNDELCLRLADYDIFATHSDYLGIPKAVLEPLLVGLPVVVNRRAGMPVAEFQGDHLLLVENSVAGYRDALQNLIDDDDFREKLGRTGYAHAQEHWAPEKTEARFVEIYRQVMEHAGNPK